MNVGSKWVRVPAPNVLAQVNPFFSTTPFLYPLKTWEEHMFSDVFREFLKKLGTWNRLTIEISDEDVNWCRLGGGGGCNYRLQISFIMYLANLSELTNFNSPLNYQKTYGFLIISGGIEFN